MTRQTGGEEGDAIVLSPFRTPSTDIGWAGCPWLFLLCGKTIACEVSRTCDSKATSRGLQRQRGQLSITGPADVSTPNLNILRQDNRERSLVREGPNTARQAYSQVTSKASQIQVRLANLTS